MLISAQYKFINYILLVLTKPELGGMLGTELPR